MKRWDELGSLDGSNQIALEAGCDEWPSAVLLKNAFGSWAEAQKAAGVFEELSRYNRLNRASKLSEVERHLLVLSRCGSSLPEQLRTRGAVWLRDFDELTEVRHQVELELIRSAQRGSNDAKNAILRSLYGPIARAAIAAKEFVPESPLSLDDLVLYGRAYTLQRIERYKTDEPVPPSLVKFRPLLIAISKGSYLRLKLTESAFRALNSSAVGPKSLRIAEGRGGMRKFGDVLSIIGHVWFSSEREETKIERARQELEDKGGYSREKAEATLKELSQIRRDALLQYRGVSPLELVTEGSIFEDDIVVRDPLGDSPEEEYSIQVSHYRNFWSYVDGLQGQKDWDEIFSVFTNAYERELDVIEYRYIDGKTLVETGKPLHVQEERARQIESHALALLRRKRRRMSITEEEQLGIIPSESQGAVASKKVKEVPLPEKVLASAMANLPRGEAEPENVCELTRVSKFHYGGFPFYELRSADGVHQGWTGPKGYYKPDHPFASTLSTEQEVWLKKQNEGS